MTFDPTKPVQTRDGRKARIICTDKKGAYPIVAVVEFGLKEEFAYSYTAIGSSINNSCLDLVNIPERTSTWQNVYKKVRGRSPTEQPSKAASISSASHAAGVSSDLVGFIRRDFEDGVFVGAEFEPYSVKEKD